MSGRSPLDAKRIRMLATPEGVALPLELADAGQRAAALLIDLIVLLVSFILMSVALLLAGMAIGRAPAYRAIGVLWLAGSFILRNFYFTWFEARPRGATVGKRILGIRVVARQGGRLTLDAVIARNALREVELFLPLTLLAAAGIQSRVAAWIVISGLGWSALFLFLPLMNGDRLRAGDLLAGTWVIRTPKRPLLPELADSPAETFSDAELDVYGIYELETLEQVIRQAHAPTISSVAETIRRRIGRQVWSDGGATKDLAFLQNYYSTLRGRLEGKLLFGIRRVDKHDRP